MAPEQIGETRKDLQAAVAARRDLGEDYESEVIDSFLARLDSRLAQRVDQVAATRADVRSARTAPTGRRDASGTWVALASLAFGIPITAVASENAGIVGTMAAWAGIAAVNLAHAIGRYARP